MTRAPANPTHRVLLTTIGVLGALPLGTGLLGILRGPEGAPGGARTTASVDSEYRFVNVFWAAAGPALWWSLARPAERAVLTRILLGLAAAGGLPRLLSVRQAGWPHPVFRATIVLELVVVPLVLAWHARVIRAR
jgi:hypothetical protein